MKIDTNSYHTIDYLEYFTFLQINLHSFCDSDVSKYNLSNKFVPTK